jgi:long-chain acyl-CoA synthetase
MLVGGVELRIPNWLFQILGLTARDIRSDGERITLLSSGATLTLQSRGEAIAQIGSCVYRHDSPALNLGTLLTSPPLWLGNEELVSFVPLDTITRQRSRRPTEGLAWADRVTDYAPLEGDRERLERAIGRSDLDLLDVDLAARMLAAPDESDALAAVDLLETVLRGEEGPLQEPARLILERQVATAHPLVRRRAFQVLVPAVREPRFPAFVGSFLSQDPEILDERTRTAVCEGTLSQEKLEAFTDATLAACEKADARACGSLLEFLAAYGSSHPISYRRLRAFLERVGLLAHDPAVRELARAASRILLDGFRKWLGANARIAVDPETGQEYRWEEVVVFDEEVPSEDRGRLLSALRDTAFLREGIFLFSKNASVRLSDIPPGGVWIRLLGTRHGKSVYRATVQTRYSGSYDLAVNVNHGLSPEEVGEEIRWLILSGDPGNRDALVEDFGGYWPEQDLWSEEFIAGETLYRSMRRLARHADGGEKLRRLWPFFARATLSAFVDFWNRSGRRFEIAQPDMTNIVVPTEDYLTGVRIVSLTRRRPHTGLLAMLRAFRTEFVAPAEEQYPELRGIVGPDVVFQSVLEIVGETVGVKLLGEALAAESSRPGDELTGRLERYLADVATRGFTPMRLHLAVER